MGERALVRTIICFFLLFLSSGALSAGIESRGLSISDIPPCSLRCILQQVPASGCHFSDVECQCHNVVLAQSISACLLANCTMNDMMDTARVQNDICNLSDESKSREVYLYSITAYSTAFIFVVLRLIGKITTKRLTIDDYTVLISILLTVVPVGCVLKMAGNGFGEHLWNLEDGQLMGNLRLFYAAWSTYIIVLGLLKVSLILFYLEIFATRPMRIALYVILAWIVINALVIFILTLFSCTPVKAFWDRDVKGKCLNINALAYANSGAAIAQDVVLLLFPLFCIRNLNMKMYRKLAVGFMFSIGTFGCIATIIRLNTLLGFQVTIDPTWDYVPVTIWTEIELSCGFVCVSLPAVRILLVTILPKGLLGSMSSKSRSRGTPTSGQSESKQPQNKEKKGFSLLNVTATTYNSNNSGRAWPGYHKLWMLGHKRLENECADEAHEVDMSHTRTWKPSTLRESRCLSDHLEMLAVSTNRLKQPCKSCGGLDDLTALPKIGCLPDASFSKEKLVRTAQQEKRVLF